MKFIFAFISLTFSGESASTESDSSPQYQNLVFDRPQADVHTYRDRNTITHTYQDLNSDAQGYEIPTGPHTNQDLNTDAQGYEIPTGPHTTKI